MPRYTKRIAFSFIFGVLTTITLAWAGAILHTLPGVYLSRSLTDFFRSPRGESLLRGSMRHAAFEHSHNGIRYQGSLWALQSRAASHTHIVIAPRLSPDFLPSPWQLPESTPRAWERSVIDAEPIQTHEYPRPHSVEAIAAGWPWKCLWVNLGHYIYPFDSFPQTLNRPTPRYEHGGIILADPPPDSFAAYIEVSPPLVVPCYPYWPGLIANTAIFASPLLLILVFIPSRRERFRRRHGLCLQCGYDIRTSLGQPCPECGPTPSRTSRPM